MVSPTCNYHKTYQIDAHLYFVSSFFRRRAVPSAFQGQPLHLGSRSHLAALCHLDFELMLLIIYCILGIVLGTEYSSTMIENIYTNE